MIKMGARAAAIVALACAGAAQAHHSGSMYDPTPVWVKGTVVRFEGINPHTITTLEERSEDGQVRRWAVEGPPQSALDRRRVVEGPDQFLLDRGGSDEDVPKVGDVIEVCAFPYKSAAELSRLFAGVDFSKRGQRLDSDGLPLQLVAGHLLVMPDGRKRLWEPHGLLSACMRSTDDRRQSWLNLLNTNPGAHQAWCEQRTYSAVLSAASLTSFVDEINRSLADPCK
ncbi:MAG TPA: DUF6152 family protein [Gammaproteobacteria bacterium]|nr:DUF6152 family protein [Gammaproteobacteria bacterium]